MIYLEIDGKERQVPVRGAVHYMDICNDRSR